MYCDQCGTKATSGAKFCQSCGAQLADDSLSKPQHTENLPAFVKTNNDIEKNGERIKNEQQGPPDQSKTFLGGKYHPWRRLFARTVDLLSSGLIVLLSFVLLIYVLFPQYVEDFEKVLENPITGGIILYLLWLPAEAAFLAAFGTTPAKWIFGIHVLSSTGDKLSYQIALKRAFLVWIQGEGLGIPLVTFFTRLFAYKRLTKTGTTLWDTSVDSVVTHKEWGVIRAVAIVLSVLAVFMILGVLNSMK